MKETLMTRDEAKKRAASIASVIPGAVVRCHAWNITVISRNGKHIVTYLGKKDGFKRTA
jgi:hypothetical protein